MLGPTLETERLILRPPILEDFDGWAAFSADRETANFLGGVQPRAAAWRSFTGVVGTWSLLDFGMFSVIEKSSGRWLGRLGPWRPEGWPGNEIGWGLVRDAWGMGYATEGSTAAVDWALERWGWTDFIHCIEPTNERSKQVARRLGSTFLRMGRLPPPFDTKTVEIWGQTREEWLARRRSGERGES